MRLDLETSAGSGPGWEKEGSRNKEPADEVLENGLGGPGRPSPFARAARLDEREGGVAWWVDCDCWPKVGAPGYSDRVFSLPRASWIEGKDCLGGCCICNCFSLSSIAL